MENDFTDITERIEQRRSAIIEALKQEEEAIRRAEATLIKRYNESVESVYNSLISSIQEQENELMSDFTKELRLLRKNNIVARNLLLKILLPTALLIGVIIGILATAYYCKDSVRIDPEKIVIAKDGTRWYQISQQTEQQSEE